MKKFEFDVWFLLRFIIVTLIYLIECLRLYAGMMIFDPRFFPFALFVYLTVIIISFFFDEYTRLKIKLVSNIVFLCLFVIAGFIGFVIDSKGMGDNLATLFCIFAPLPLSIAFFIWFVRDIKAIIKLKGKEVLGIEDFSGDYFTRILLLVILYGILNHVSPFKYLLASEFFWIFIIAYFVMFLVGIFLEKKKAARLHLSINAFFLGIISIHALYLMFRFMLAGAYRQLDFDFELFDIIASAPMFALFAAWLVWDIKKLGKLKEE